MTKKKAPDAANVGGSTSESASAVYIGSKCRSTSLRPTGDPALDLAERLLLREFREDAVGADRTLTLIHFAQALLKRGVPPDRVPDLSDYCNETTCKPPLAKVDVRLIARLAVKFWGPQESGDTAAGGAHPPRLVDGPLPCRLTLAASP